MFIERSFLRIRMRSVARRRPFGFPIGHPVDVAPNALPPNSTVVRFYGLFGSAASVERLPPRHITIEFYVLVSPPSNNNNNNNNNRYHFISVVDQGHGFACLPREHRITQRKYTTNKSEIISIIGAILMSSFIVMFSIPTDKLYGNCLI